MSMRTVLLACSRGDESPTVGILTRTGYGLLLKAFTGTIQYNGPSPTTRFGDIGFEHVNFFGTPILFDDGVPSARGFMLNLKYMKLLVHRDRDMSIRDFIAPVNEDSIVDRIYWAGNLVCYNLARQGILQGSLDTDA